MCKETKCLFDLQTYPQFAPITFRFFALNGYLCRFAKPFNALLILSL